MIEIIEKKRLGKELTKEEIEYVVREYTKGSIPDYQMSALLMAICINGMTEEETINLTDSFINSGEVIDTKNIQGTIVDKHSTGGVGDKTTLVIAPVLATLGYKVLKMSGRGLGFTGGTIDKLESIKGYQVEEPFTKVENQINEIGLAIISQTQNLVPADKKIYALRDVTATVSSIPLIASSIMSKKIASGASTIVIDVKVGEGALLKNITDARKLSNLMIKIGKKYNRKIICVLTNMDSPLGKAIGNSNEVLEAIDALNGKGPKDLMDLVKELASEIMIANENITKEEALKKIEEKINSKEAYNKFLELVKFQGGDINTLALSKRVFSIKTDKEGYIKSINALKIGELVKKMGGGRLEKSDPINHEVGITLTVGIGDKVKPNDELMRIYLGDKDLSFKELSGIFTISNVKEEPKLIYEIIK